MEAALHGVHKYKMYLANMDAKILFDVAKSGVISKPLTETGVHGMISRRWPVSSRVKQSSGTRGVSGNGEVGPDFVDDTGTVCSVAHGRKRRAGGAALCLRGEEDREYLLCSILWADTFWITSEKRGV